MGAWLLLLFACELPTPVERNCEERRAFYPDEDGDGIGDPDRVYIGCSPPAGWVFVPPDRPDTGGSGPTGETSGQLATGDTGPVPTGDTSATTPTGATGDTASVPTGDTSDTAASGTADTGPASTADTGADATGDTASVTTGSTAHTGSPTADTGAAPSTGHTGAATATGDTGP